MDPVKAATDAPSVGALRETYIDQLDRVLELHSSLNDKRSLLENAGESASSKIQEARQTLEKHLNGLKIASLRDRW